MSFEVKKKGGAFGQRFDDRVWEIGEQPPSCNTKTLHFCLQMLCRFVSEMWTRLYVKHPSFNVKL